MQKVSARMRKALIVCGLGVVFGLSAIRLSEPGVERAQAQPARPTLTPLPRPTLTPTLAVPIEPDDEGEKKTSPAPGRITGTVIEFPGGAPVPGIEVAVGESVVTTDGNGNYDLAGLPSGSYVVSLLISEMRGTPEQPPLILELAPGATVVQHLAFRSVQTDAPTAAPEATSEPTPSPPIPVALPVTGGWSGATSGWLWLGSVLLLVGLGIKWLGRKEQAPDD